MPIKPTKPEITSKARMSAVLRAVARGKLSPQVAEKLLRENALYDLGFACIDLARPERCGMPEVIYCPGKTAEQVVAAMRALTKQGQPVFATRATPAQYAEVRRAFPRAVYHAAARAIMLNIGRTPKPFGGVGVVCAGTTDIPVAEEAAVTAEWLGARVERVFDVGVAGLHRLVRHLPRLRQMRVLIAVAGMEGALPSVVGGLVPVPVIAVPTSVGYGASFQGVTALLAMLNSCVPGVVVVNIDNGFGAGVAAAKINRLGQSRLKQ